MTLALLLAAIIELVPGVVATTPGGRLAHIEAVSTVAAGTANGRVWLYVE